MNQPQPVFSIPADWLMRTQPHWDDLRPTSESFAYFFQCGSLDELGDGRAGSRHLCQFLSRDGQLATVRLDTTLRGTWQDVPVPVRRLEMLSREERRQQLRALDPDELWDLARSYGLRLQTVAGAVELVLDFEFCRFAGVD